MAEKSNGVVDVGGAVDAEGVLDVSFWDTT